MIIYQYGQRTGRDKQTTKIKQTKKLQIQNIAYPKILKLNLPLFLGSDAIKSVFEFCRNVL